MSTSSKSFRPKPRIPPRTFVTVSVDAQALQNEWSYWPELSKELAKMKFKRYHAYVTWSEVVKFAITGGDRQVETLNLALVGPAPPEQPGFVDEYIFEVDKDGPSAYCHPLAFPLKTPSTSAKTTGRTPLQVAGPPLTKCKAASACVYTGRTFDVVATTLVQPAEDAEKRWSFTTYAEDAKLEKSLFADDGKLQTLETQWRKTPSPEYANWPKGARPRERTPPTHETALSQDGTVTKLIEGVDPVCTEITLYKIPMIVSFDLDAEEEIADPAGFKKDVLAIKRMLYEMDRMASGLSPFVNDKVTKKSPSLLDSIPSGLVLGLLGAVAVGSIASIVAFRMARRT